MTTAIVLGAGGQDGSYLCEELLHKNYRVCGVVRHSSLDNTSRLTSWVRNHNLFYLAHGDITSESFLHRLLKDLRPYYPPDYLYNMADQDSVGFSVENPELSMDVTARAVVTILEAVRQYSPSTRVFQPCSATMFGDAPPPQDEETPLNPLSPYACAKAAAYHLARYYRQVHGLWVSTAILYNHDSPRRQDTYLLGNICTQASAVARGEADAITVGDSSMVVDVGYALDYVRDMITILEHSEPDDFVVSSIFSNSIGGLINLALDLLGVKLCIVKDDRSLLRAGPQPTLYGNMSKFSSTLGTINRIGARELLRKLLEVRHGMPC